VRDSATFPGVVPGPTDEYGVGAYRNLELSNAGSSMIRWALGIGPASSWKESRVQVDSKDGFTLLAWNRKPVAKAAFEVSAKEAGLKGDGRVFEVRLDGPSYRQPAEFAVSWKADGIGLVVNRPGTLRPDYGTVRPG
jgi:hypothetical protein